MSIMNVALDFDGCISANFQHYYQLGCDLEKSGHKVFILTAANPKRLKYIQDRLLDVHFPYYRVITRPFDFVSTQKNIGAWKKKMLIQYDIDLWFDNEVKPYEKEGIDFSDIKTFIVRI